MNKREYKKIPKKKKVSLKLKVIMCAKLCQPFHCFLRDKTERIV